MNHWERQRVKDSYELEDREIKMRIRLTVDLPIDPLLDMVKGREFDVIERGGTWKRPADFYVLAFDGEEVGVFARECEIIDHGERMGDDEGWP